MKHLQKILIVLAMAVMIPAFPASATSYAGQLIKGSSPAVFYVMKTNTRLLFPDEATFKSWYPDFRGVITLQNWEVNQIPLAGSVTMKPGSAPIKAKGDNTVYAVARYGVARPFATPSAASIVYGKNWSSKIVTVDAAMLASYVRGTAVVGPDQYWWMRELTSVKTIDDNFDATFNGIRHLPNVTVAQTAQLTVKANVVNGNDGRYNATEADTALFVGALPVRSGQAYTLAPGDYTLYQNEERIQGYLISDWGGDCLPGGTVGLKPGDKKACTITYTYSPLAASEPILTMNVNVINDYRGGSLPNDFPITVGSTFVRSGEPHAYAPGWYNVLTYNHSQGYVPVGWTSGDCIGNGASPGGASLELKRGHSYTCTYTYDDVNRDQLNPTMGTLVVGASYPSTLKASDVKLFIEGKQVTSGQLNDVDPRAYTVYFSVPSGYTGSWTGTGCNQGSVWNSAYVTGEVLKIKSCLAIIRAL